MIKGILAFLAIGFGFVIGITVLVNIVLMNVGIIIIVAILVPAGIMAINLADAEDTGDNPIKRWWDEQP